MRPIHIADRYARSIFELAEEQGQGETLANEIEVFAGAVQRQPRFLDLLENPLIARQEKRALIRNAVGKSAGATQELPLLEQFLTLLAQKGRINLFRVIVRSLHHKFNEKKGIQEAIVVTARPLDSDGAEQLKEALEKMTGKKIALNLLVNSHLLGGIQIRIGNRLLDGSLRTKLAALGAQLRFVRVQDAKT